MTESCLAVTRVKLKAEPQVLAHRWLLLMKAIIYIFYTFIQLIHVSSFCIRSFYTNFILSFTHFYIFFYCTYMDLYSDMFWMQKHVFHQIDMQSFNTSIWRTVCEFHFCIYCHFPTFPSAFLNQKIFFISFSSLSFFFTPVFTLVRSLATIYYIIYLHICTILDP